MLKAFFCLLTVSFGLFAFSPMNVFGACAWYDIMCHLQSKNDTSVVNSTFTSGTGNPVITTPSPSASSPDVAESQSNNCDPSYPDFCIPPPTPNLNCADIPQKRFTVTGPDPHGFDRDGDGVGCES